jgi:hypothetical protein
MSTIPTTGSAQLTEQYGAPLYLNSLKMVWKNIKIQTTIMNKW